MGHFAVISGRLRIRPSGVVAAGVFASFVAYYGLCCFRTAWVGDLQIHCAAVSQLYRNLLHPAHEAMNVPGTLSTAYTPYLVLVGALGRLSGVTPYRALQVAGLVNLVLYVWAIHQFVRRFSMHRHAGLASAVFLLVSLYLRWRHFGWSSETSLLSMQLVQAYPSTAGWAMALFALGLAEDLRHDRSALRTAGLAALLGLLLLSHVLTASWVIGMLGLRGLYVLARDRDGWFLLRLGIAIAAALALAALWPYSPFFGQSRLLDIHVQAEFGRRPLADFANLYLVALPCAAWLLGWRRRHLFAVLAFAATFAALAICRALGITFGNRYSFFMAFWAQLLVSEAATAGILALRARGNGPASPSRRAWLLDRLAPVLLLAAAALAWLPSPMWRQDSRRGPARLLSPRQLWRLPPSHDQYYQRWAGLAPYLHRGDVVLMPVDRAAFDIASVTGAQVIASPNALWAPGFMSRASDVALFFSEQASSELRLQIASRHCATRVWLATGDGRAADLEAMFGAAVHRDGTGVLFDLQPYLRDRCP